MSGLEPLLASAAFQSLSTAAAIGGTVLSTVGAISAAEDKAESDRLEAKNMEAQANEQRAASQRNAEQKQKQARLVLSRQQAVSAASGGSATDPTVLDLGADVAGEGEYQANMIQYEGEARGSSLDYGAALKRRAASNAETSGFINAGTSLLSGVSNWSKHRRGYFGRSPSYAD